MKYSLYKFSRNFQEFPLEWFSSEKQSIWLQYTLTLRRDYWLTFPTRTNSVSYEIYWHFCRKFSRIILVHFSASVHTWKIYGQPTRSWINKSSFFLAIKWKNIKDLCLRISANEVDAFLHIIGEIIYLSSAYDAVNIFLTATERVTMLGRILQQSLANNSPCGFSFKILQHGPKICISLHRVLIMSGISVHR